MRQRQNQNLNVEAERGVGDRRGHACLRDERVSEQEGKQGALFSLSCLVGKGWPN